MRFNLFYIYETFLYLNGHNFQWIQISLDLIFARPNCQDFRVTFCQLSPSHSLKESQINFCHFIIIFYGINTKRQYLTNNLMT